MSRFGIIHGEPIADYHANAAWGHSKLETFRDEDRGQARAFGQFITGTIPKRESTDAMDIGNSVDALVLERKTIFAELPATYVDAKGEEKKFTMASNSCKAMVAEIELSRGLIALNRFDCALVRQMRDAVFANPFAAALLSVGQPQTTMRHPFGAFAVQSRPDWWNHEGVTLPDGEKVGAYICDLKSAEDADQFLKNRRAFGYSRQAALYREITRLVLASVGGVPVEEVKAPEFFFLVVYKTAPIECVVFKETDEEMEIATNEVVDDLRMLRRAYETGLWRGCPSGIVELPKIWRKAA